MGPISGGDHSINLNREGSLLPTPPSSMLIGSTFTPMFNNSLLGGGSSLDGEYYYRPRPEFLTLSRIDVHGWLYRVEQLLEFFTMSLDQKVRMAALYLKGKPLRWYLWSVRLKGGPLEWHEFEKGFIEMYDVNHNTSYAGELSKLRQEGSLED